jgi:hypothetical protein
LVKLKLIIVENKLAVTLKAYVSVIAIGNHFEKTFTPTSLNNNKRNKRIIRSCCFSAADQKYYGPDRKIYPQMA